MGGSNHESEIPQLTGPSLSLYKAVCRYVLQEWRGPLHYVVLRDRRAARDSAKESASARLHDMIHGKGARIEYAGRATDAPIIRQRIAAYIDSLPLNPDTSGIWLEDPDGRPKVNKVRSTSRRRSTGTSGRHTLVRDYDLKTEWIGGRVVWRGGGFESNRRRH
jgi:hypothetical protein